MVIADSGSTKTTWALIDSQNNIITKKESIGLNPFFVDVCFIKKTSSKIIETADKKKISAVYFYGAGCANDEKCNLVKKGLTATLPNTKIFIYSDLLAAARALFQKQKGWVCILGTGSNAAYYNGRILIKHTPSLGYILGDEGSGTYLGKLLLQHILYHKLDKTLTNAFHKKYNLDLQNILLHTYSKPNPNKYLASFTHFLKEYENHSSIQQLIYNGFSDFIKNHIQPYMKNDIETIGFIGSVAFSFKEILIQACLDHNLTVLDIQKSPMDGLIKYHIQNNRK